MESPLTTILWPMSTWAHMEDVSKAPRPTLYTVWKTKSVPEVGPEVGKGEVILDQ